MWRILLSALLVAGCAQLPPPPEDMQAKKFEPASNRSVIYISRQLLDSPEGGVLTLDERSTITTYQGTYYRWEVDPGMHRVASFGFGTAAVTLNTSPGGVYFVQHTVLSDRQDGGVIMVALQQVSDEAGRTLVSRNTLLR